MKRRGATYRRGNTYAKETGKILVLAKHPERDHELNQYELSVIQEIRRTLSPRMTECMYDYYVRAMAVYEIGDKLEVNISTVSRTIRRGEDHLDRILRLARSISPVRMFQEEWR